jgi:hypothetical protein
MAVDAATAFLDQYDGKIPDAKHSQPEERFVLLQNSWAQNTGVSRYSIRKRPRTSRNHADVAGD